MNSSFSSPAPMICDQRTDLQPFFTHCINEAKMRGGLVYSSITFETSYCDPLAVLEQIHTNKKSIYYIKEWNGGINVGHDMCSGAFTYKNKGMTVIGPAKRINNDNK